MGSGGWAARSVLAAAVALAATPVVPTLDVAAAAGLGQPPGHPVAPARAAAPRLAADWPQPPVPWAGVRWQAAQAGAAAWPVGVSSSLVPTGLALAGGSGVEGIVSDGAGAVWVDGAWQVSRIDPDSGRAELWDAADDASFGLVERLVATPGPGVWLLEQHRARLFDGTRFVVDLPVPAQYRGDGPIDALVQRGTEVWVGSRAGVARWADGQWSMVGLGELVGVAALAVDATGSVWASGDLLTADGARSRVVRLDGERWSLPGQGFVPRDVIELAADPSGGVVARRGALAPGIYRFEAGVWHDLSDGILETQVGELADQAITVSGDGRVWLAGRGGVAARLPLGSWQSVVRPRWASAAAPSDGPVGDPLREPRGVAVVRGGAVAADLDGVVRLRGSTAERIWRDPGIRGTGPLADPMTPFSSLAAAAADDVWLQAHGWYSSPTVRFHAGAWRQVRPPDEAWWNGVVGGVLTVADDGAVWAVGATGLVRHAADGTGWARIRPDVGLDQGRGVAAEGAAQLWPGRDGSVWVRSSTGPADGPRGSLIEVDPAGSSRQVALPGRGAVGTAPDESRDGDPKLLPTADGSVWAVQPVTRPDGRVRQVVLRWRDGRWRRIAPLPGTPEWVGEPVVTGDGALWVPAAGAEGSFLATYSGGRWSQVPVEVLWLRASGDEVCGIEGIPVWQGWWVGEDGTPEAGHQSLCVGGQPLRVRRLLDLPVVAMDVAPDGSVWVLGEQLARLPGRAG